MTKNMKKLLGEMADTIRPDELAYLIKIHPTDCNKCVFALEAKMCHECIFGRYQVSNYTEAKKK